MFEQDRISTSYNDEFLMNSKGVEYLTGNAKLDTTGIEAGSVIPGGTAIHKNTETGLFELVSDTDTGPFTLPALTRHSVKVEADKATYSSAITAGNPIEELCSGVTDAFKSANQRYTWY